jgi:hypothetical protein
MRTDTESRRRQLHRCQRRSEGQLVVELEIGFPALPPFVFRQEHMSRAQDYIDHEQRVTAMAKSIAA